MAFKINRVFSLKITQWLLCRFIQFYSLFFRLEVQNEDVWLDGFLNRDERFLLCLYHQQFFPMLCFFPGYKGCNPGVIVSLSKDGELISSVIEKIGWLTVRGSSSKGGKEAVREMITHMAENRMATHMVDGPRGPYGVIKPGAIRIAHITNSYVVPFYIDADRAWYAKSWDKFMIPKPFSKVIMRFGDKIKYEQTDTEAAFEEQRKSLEEIMVKGNEAMKRAFDKE